MRPAFLHFSYVGRTIPHFAPAILRSMTANDPVLGRLSTAKWTTAKDANDHELTVKENAVRETTFANKDGEFKRVASAFRDTIVQGGRFPPAAGRYHLYTCLACPWAHRVMITRALKGLEDAISVSVVDWFMGPEGWKFTSDEECPGSTEDTVNNAKFIQEIYFKTDPDYQLRFTVPLLWDKVENTIVNNESSEIMRMLNEAFDEFSSAPGTTFYPKDRQEEIDSLNEWILPNINNGVYQAGFATAQGPYEKAVNALFEGMDRVESILKTKQFLTGDVFTEADIRLFTTCYRFDPVYHTHFKCANKTITHDYPHILRWMREIYQMPGIAPTCNMDHCKYHYYQSHKNINPSGIVPLWNGPKLN